MKPLFNHRHWAIKITRPAISGRKWSRLPELARRRPALKLRGASTARGGERATQEAVVGYPVERDSGASWTCVVRMFDREFKIEGVDPDQAFALAEWFAVDQLTFKGFRIIERQRFIRFRPKRMKPYVPRTSAAA